MNDLSQLIHTVRSQRLDRISEEDPHALTSVDFIESLFTLLGWDMGNRQERPTAQREVIRLYFRHPPNGVKAYEYAFQTNGMRKFLVEVMRSPASPQHVPPLAYHLRRWAWSSGLILSILTDFETFSVYDCRHKPQVTDGPEVARIGCFHVDQLEERWSWFQDLFSREAVATGAHTAYAARAPKQNGIQAVEDAFLQDMESWRLALAQALAAANPSVEGRDLNESVQQLVNRILFLRIAEDRGVEPYGQLRSLAVSPNAYAELNRRFQSVQAMHGSRGLQWEEQQPQAGQPNPAPPVLELPDRPVQAILGSLYAPDCPYEFSALPADLLGQVYERFLGGIIEFRRDRSVHVVPKSTVRKLGGVYYTPAYVVRYIVDRTLGPALEGKSASQARTVKVLDPACGSGSFLIAAYQYLLDWYLDWYLANDPHRHAHASPPPIAKGQGNEWTLTFRERRRILTTHIFGVDLDHQAVEVAKLALVLKALEGDSNAERAQSPTTVQADALSTLSDHITCGNALVGTDFVDVQQAAHGADVWSRVRPFDWWQAFPAVFARPQPGFDVIVGNPPYRRERDHKALLDELATTPFGRRHHTARMDLWYYFVHRSIEVLRHTGRLSFIVNAYWTSGAGAEKLIEAFETAAHLEELFVLGDLPVFREVSGRHLIFRAVSHAHGRPALIRVAQEHGETSAEPFVEGYAKVVEYQKEQADLIRNGRIDLEPSAAALLTKIEQGSPLGDLGLVRQGIAENPSRVNKKTNRQFNERWSVGEGVFVLSPAEHANLNLNPAERAVMRRYHHLSDLGRYYLAAEPSKHLIYTTKRTAPTLDGLPALERHLARFRPIMERRRETRAGSNGWWQLHWPRDEQLFMRPKVVSLQMAARPSFTVATEPVYVSFSTNVFVPHHGTAESVEYFAALLNSRLLWKWFQHNAKRRGVGLEINGHVLRRSPIRRIDFSIPWEADLHRIMVSRVQTMQNLTKILRCAHESGEKDRLQRALQSHNAQIDQAVFRLYDLDASEIHEVFEATRTTERTPSAEPIRPPKRGR